MSYNTLASLDQISKTVNKLTQNNFEGFVVETKEEALAKIKELIPSGASVMNGSSTTLNEIGYIDYLKEGNHGWKNLHHTVLNEKDPNRQAYLRKETTISDYYLGSVHALTENGELVVVSNTGSQLPSIAYNSDNLIFVVSSQKIVSDLNEGLKRIENQVIPLEDERMMKAYNMHTLHSKTFIYHKERPNSGRKIKVLIVREKLGF